MLNRRNNLTIQQIKEEIEKLKGKKINMSINQGRKRFVDFDGVIQDAYNSIFVVKLTNKYSHSAIDELRNVIENDLNHKDETKENNLDSTNEINQPINDIKTYSYIDILCGNVNIKHNSLLSQNE